MVLTGAAARDIGLAAASAARQTGAWLSPRRRILESLRRRRQAGTAPPRRPPPRSDERSRRGSALELDLETDPPQAAPPETRPVPPPAEEPRPRPRRRVREASPTDGLQPALFSALDTWRFPPLELLEEAEVDDDTEDHHHEATENILLVEDTLESFGISAKVVHYERGPAITRYEVEPVRGVRVARVANLANDLACALAALNVRIEAPVPGKNTIGIEVPNRRVAIVTLREVLESETMREHPSKLAFAVGKDIAGETVVGDLSRMPHLLVAGATNAGKSVGLNALITSILYRARPDEVKLILVDPKRVELSIYDGIPHLIAPVVQTAAQAADVLRKAIQVMEHRFDLFAVRGVRNIAEYNAAVLRDTESEEEPIPYIVIVIDELADLMMQARPEFEYSICRLAQLARATGIHLVVATQRPSVDVITGLIKANISSRISLAVASQHDSRTILDHAGAERLIGRGDMLYAPIDATKPRRVQGAYIGGPEIERVVEFIRAQGEPEYEIIPEVSRDGAGAFGDEGDPSDALYDAAVQHVVSAGEASVSMLQRRFRIGYARAGRLIDLMARRGVVGPSEGSKPRRVLMLPGQFAPDSAAGFALETTVTDDAPVEPPPYV
jgi:S-DNA-T family DNA segregation ATPase FtsK/SpoIIIE